MSDNEMQAAIDQDERDAAVLVGKIVIAWAKLEDALQRPLHDFAGAIQIRKYFMARGALPPENVSFDILKRLEEYDKPAAASVLLRYLRLAIRQINPARLAYYSGIFSEVNDLYEIRNMMAHGVCVGFPPGRGRVLCFLNASATRKLENKRKEIDEKLLSGKINTKQHKNEIARLIPKNTLSFEYNESDLQAAATRIDELAQIIRWSAGDPAFKDFLTTGLPSGRSA